MSEPETPPPPVDPNAPKPGQARSRLPFESDEAIRKRGGGQTVAWLYATLAIALVGLAGYMALIEEVAVTDPRVWLAGLVAVWFIVRAVMTAQKR